MRIYFILILAILGFTSCEKQKGPFLKITSDLDCQLFVDGVDKGLVKAGEENVKKIPIDSGECVIVAKTLDGIDKKVMNISMEKKDKVLHIELKNIYEKRISQKTAFKNIDENMILVNGGSFLMGCKEDGINKCDDDQKPLHKVTVSSFYISKYEVTVSQFRLFAEKTGYITEAENEGWSFVFNSKIVDWDKVDNVSWKTNNVGDKKSVTEDNHPVVHISWNDAIAFCEWISNENGKNYRLPTEAEWEYAARGGESTKNYKYSGSDNIEEVAWYRSNSTGKTHPVGQKKPNELGLYDMAGNVSEWCSDWYDEKYYEKSIIKNPLGAQNGKNKVMRGGGWRGSAVQLVADRSSGYPDGRYDGGGFRLLYPVE
jgi:formylglycine-generating enzyme required for sulfatase activity